MRAPIATAALAAILSACGGGAADLARAHNEHIARRRAFAALADRDPVVAEALAAGGNVVIGLRPALIEGVLRQVAAGYLDRVVLDLPLDKRVRESKVLHLSTFLGRVNAGTWTLEVTIHRVRGRLRARAPAVTAAPGNALRLEAPVSIEEGHGSATVRFEWDSRSLASVVCRDFEVTRRLQGQVLSGEYTVSGEFRLSAGPETVRAEPAFPPREFRVRVDLSAASWAEVRTAIDEQDQILRCGLALDADDVIARLRVRLHEGFDIKLPRSLFRAVDFPAAVRQAVTIQDHRVELGVKTRELTVSPTAVWYSADVRTHIEGSSAPAPGARPGLR
jgi:hypothetical protein